MNLDLKELAELAGMINALKNSKEVEEILIAVQTAAYRIKPIIEQASAFRTELDLQAIGRMTKWGLSNDQAVAVICARHNGQGMFGSVAGKALAQK